MRIEGTSTNTSEDSSHSDIFGWFSYKIIKTTHKVDPGNAG